VIAPVQIVTARDEEMRDPNRALVVNRASRTDLNVVISFWDRKGVRDAIGIPPDEAIKFATAIVAAAMEVKHR
jgi:hypothetical protein